MILQIELLKFYLVKIQETDKISEVFICNIINKLEDIFAFVFVYKFRKK